MKKSVDKPSGGVKEIARLAQVSIATVDRVIHNRTGVSEKTKQKIQSIIEKLNYQPNVLARRLALTSKSPIRLIALLPNISNETAFWKAPLDGIKKAETEIKQYGIEVDIHFFDQNDRASFDKQVKKILRKKIDGIVFTPTFPDESIVLAEHCKDKTIPYIMINSDIPGYDALCYIGADIFQSGYLAAQLVNYCITRNDKILIVKIAREIDNNYAILRKEDGFRAYFRDNLISNKLLTLDSKQTDYTSVSRKLDQIFKKEGEINAMFVTNSRVSVVAKYLQKSNRMNVLLLGYDFIEDNVDYLKRGIIDFLICEKPQEQGYKGIMTLFQHLIYSHAIEKKYLVPIDIVTKENYLFYRN